MGPNVVEQIKRWVDDLTELSNRMGVLITFGYNTIWFLLMSS